MSLKFSITTNAGIVRLRRLEQSLSPRALDKALLDTAWSVQRLLRARTPVGLTGRLKKLWRVWKMPAGGYQISNDRPDIIRHLEFGTVAHGPVTAKALFIPLTRRAAIGGWNPSLVRGRDYILRKWVRGIRATHLVRDSLRDARMSLRERVTNYVAKLVRRK